MAQTDIANTLAILREQESAIRARGVTGLYVFGSRVRGDNSQDSDLDAFVDYDPAEKFSLLDFIAVQRSLAEALGIKIDMATRRSLHPLLRDRIEREAVKVF